MAEEFYDISGDKDVINRKYDDAGKKAKEIHDAGKLKLVSEKICAPYNGYGFKLDKGQTIRYELIDGPQILDTIYHVRSRPTKEWACTYHSSVFGAQCPYDGMHYYSNTPFTRPLLTILKDTVDYKKLKAAYGPAAAHNFIYNSGRCTSGLYEQVYGVVNANSCDLNLKQGLVEVMGEEMARMINTPAAFMHFQAVAFDKIPTNITYYPAGDIFKRGDYVELLAHEDLYAVVSLCPVGTQEHFDQYEDFTCYPVRVAIYEDEDGPLETAPDPKQKTMDGVDFVVANRPNMVTGKIGKKRF